MTGASGFVGSYLAKAFVAKGWKVIPLTRSDLALPAAQLAAKIDGADYAVNLAGAPVIGRWSEQYKKNLCDSRINTTQKLIEAFALMQEKPKVFISTSAIGYYTDQGVHTEVNGVQADGFLGQLAQDWEQEAFKAKELNIRTLVFRFGVVLGRDGGPMKKMLPPFKLGLGGKIGTGKQHFSWIHIEDLLRVYWAAFESAEFQGVYNLTAPQPTDNLGLTKALGKVLSRPTLFPVPAFVLRLLFGEGAQILTGGQAAIPQRLLDSSFEFQYPDLEQAIAECI